MTGLAAFVFERQRARLSAAKEALIVTPTSLIEITFSTAKSTAVHKAHPRALKSFLQPIVAKEDS
jgi:hypothetical protein